MHAALGDFCEFVQGGRHKLSGKHFVEVGYPAYGAGGINGFLPEPEFDRSAVVLSAIGARCGKCFLAEGEWSSLANTQLIFPDNRKADVRFLWYQLNDESRWIRRGLAQPFIRPSDVKAHLVYLPSLDEQRRIAAILREADELRLKCKRAMALLDGLTRAIFDDMFGAIKDVRGRADISTFGDIAQESLIGLVRSAAELTDSPIGTPYVRMDAILSDGRLSLSPVRRTECSAKEMARYELRDGDFLFNTRNSRDLVGKSTVYSGPPGHIYNNNILRVRFKKGIDPLYIQAFFQTPGAKKELEARKSGTTSVFAIYQKSLYDLPVVVPPTQAQEAFGKRIRKVAELFASFERHQILADRLFASLQHRAFTGQL